MGGTPSEPPEIGTFYARSHICRLPIKIAWSFRLYAFSKSRTAERVFMTFDVGENCIMRSCMVCTLHPVLLGRLKQGG
jgi:hypothetical protein